MVSRLSIDIIHNCRFSSPGGRSVNSTTSRLLSSLSHVERLTADNKYNCTQCLHHVEAEISSHYVDLPPILTIHIKRFARYSVIATKFNSSLTI